MRGKNPLVAKKPRLTAVSTKIIADDVFADVLELERPRFVVDYGKYLAGLWNASPKIHELLRESATLEAARDALFAFLERVERGIGVDLYYAFNMKGKKETGRYMVPIARILQERKEEARLLPGLDRTDEPVFNVPKLGKNHLRAMQDHRLVMIRSDGCRVYEFHPWEKNISPAPSYNYLDVPIYDYLEELVARGENIRDYRTIWFYY